MKKQCRWSLQILETVAADMEKGFGESEDLDFLTDSLG